MPTINHNSMGLTKSKISFWDILIIYILYIFSTSFIFISSRYYLGLFIVIMFLLALIIVKPNTNLIYLGVFAGILNTANSSSLLYALIYFLIVTIAIYVIFRFNLLNNNPKLSFLWVIAVIVITLDGRVLGSIYNDLSLILIWTMYTFIHIICNYILFRFFLYFLEKKRIGAN